MRESHVRARTIGCAPSPTVSSSTTPTRRWCRCSLPHSTRSRRSSSVRRWSARSAAHGSDPTRPAGAGARRRRAARTSFGGAVIEALGDYKAHYALDAITAIAKLDGPLQDDAAIALGSIGDKRALETLAGLQRTAPRSAQPAVAAGICLLGVNCASHESYLIETLKFADQNPGFQELLRGAAIGSWRAGDQRSRLGGLDALLRRRHPLARSDARAGGAGARAPSRCATRR